ncbi:MAG TPA: hypothetical protein VMY37_32155 [Thermoguttaceae bacterium]|nr:hypothetical protein [Thermoguttaceae bacterium]
MTTPEPDDPRAGGLARRLQYTSRTLLALTTAVAIACAIFFTLPPWVSMVAAVCVVISMPAVLTVMLIYGQGYTRTFCIGALFPAGVCLSPVASYYSFQIVGEVLNKVLDSLEPNIAVLVFLNVYFAVVLGNGLLAVGVRRLMEAGGPTPAPPSPTDEASGTAEMEASGNEGAEGQTPGEEPYA